MRDFKEPGGECPRGTRAYIINLLFAHGANPNIYSVDVKHTPLHWLCYWGDWRAVELLLQYNKTTLINLERE